MPFSFNPHHHPGRRDLSPFKPQKADPLGTMGRVEASGELLVSIGVSLAVRHCPQAGHGWARGREQAHHGSHLQALTAEMLVQLGGLRAGDPSTSNRFTDEQPRLHWPLGDLSVHHLEVNAPQLDRSGSLQARKSSSSVFPGDHPTSRSGDPQRSASPHFPLAWVLPGVDLMGGTSQLSPDPQPPTSSPRRLPSGHN